MELEEICNDYDKVQDDLRNVLISKLAQYGTKRYEEQDRVFNRWMCYSDVYRKFIRLEQQVHAGTAVDLIETYSDLANYAIMAIQLLKKEQQ